ncbi:lantibiotic dehydratase [Nonomuraea diastatica]|uniref:Lantibiotic dehydratase N-terminal domain-containing protein n=1 Tax=Nonomuraea diastatica TaxID=1848329 RepID=A0A4R4W583_9ACTN|nr:hypothetical protein E1294_45445 [Nonomuraea diastatica]
MAALPFQPRVRYRSTILTPARWPLPATVTGARGSRLGRRPAHLADDHGSPAAGHRRHRP